MGKHDKQEEQKVEFKWDPPKDEWYKARITELKNENARLRDANAGIKNLKAAKDLYAKEVIAIGNESYGFKTQLEELQEEYAKALGYIEELEQAKFNLESKIEEYESAILKVVVQI